MSDTGLVPVELARVRTNNFWWIVAVVAVVAVAVFAVLCTVRGGHFTGEFAIGSKSIFGSKVYIACQ